MPAAFDLEELVEETLDAAKEQECDVYDASHDVVERAMLSLDAMAVVNECECMGWLEIDSGLWEGQDPREALETQAFFTLKSLVARYAEVKLEDAAKEVPVTITLRVTPKGELQVPLSKA